MEQDLQWAQTMARHAMAKMVKRGLVFGQYRLGKYFCHSFWS